MKSKAHPYDEIRNASNAYTQALAVFQKFHAELVEAEAIRAKFFPCELGTLSSDNRTFLVSILGQTILCEMDFRLGSPPKGVLNLHAVDRFNPKHLCLLKSIPFGIRDGKTDLIHFSEDADETPEKIYLNDHGGIEILAIAFIEILQTKPVPTATDQSS